MANEFSFKTLLLGTALVVPSVYATGAAAQDDLCVQLEQRVAGTDLTGTAYTEEEFVRIVEQGDQEECRLWLAELEAVVVDVEGGAQTEAQSEAQVTETERARVTLEDEVVIEGFVWVDQQPAEVAVEEAPVEIMVNNAEPEVTVREQPAEILIRQAAPTIRLDMPQPTITIEQPAPEIIVTMPPPNVDVANARPTIEVRQAEPRVSVTQPEPQVELELRQAENPETSEGIQIGTRTGGQEGAPAPEPQVSLSRAEAQVTYQEASGQQASAQVERAQPSVRFEQAEPQVEVTSQGEPQVSWTQAGEATVTYQEAGAEQPQGEQQQAMATEAEAQTGAGAVMEGNAPQVEREGFQRATIEEIDATRLTGARVYGPQDEEVGEIGDLAMSESGQVQEAVIDVGGFLGMGERHVRVPFQDMTILRGQDGEELRVYINATEEQLESYPEVEN